MKVKVQLGAGAVLGVAAVAAVAWVAWRASKGVGSLATAASDAAGKVVDAASYAVQQITPWNPDNVAARTVNAGVSAATGRDETLGGWLRSVTSDDDAKIEAMLTGKTAPASSPQWSTGGGKWNNPSAYTALEESTPNSYGPSPYGDQFPYLPQGSLF